MMEFVTAEPWAPHPKAAPVTERRDDAFLTRSNGTRFCCGGWQFLFADIAPGHAYRIELRARHEAVAVPEDMLVGHACWGTVSRDEGRTGATVIWDYVTRTELDDSRILLRAVLEAPAEATALTVRATLRWTANGHVEWEAPSIRCLGPASRPEPITVAVVTGTEEDTATARNTLDKAVAYYAERCERACGEHGAQLLALPEVCLQWNVPGHAFDNAVSVPGPETDVFADIARRHSAVVVLGVNERERDAVRNSAVIIDATGEIAGIYHKVHLASFEATSGVLPGDGFPVCNTRAGRIGCNICMDSSAAESSRMVGLNGADFLVLPIMGDHRASRWTPGPPQLDEERWRSIMRVRAMDNQLCMVVARNRSRGSCIIDRSGRFLAYNDGTADTVVAAVDPQPGFRKWNGGCFRQVNWQQRRPHLYGAFCQNAPQAFKRLSATRQP